MPEISRIGPAAQTIDLATVRETLSYMHDDMRNVPGLERIAGALETALKEINTAQCRLGSPRRDNSLPRQLTARFLPRRT